MRRYPLKSLFIKQCLAIFCISFISHAEVPSDSYTTINAFTSATIYHSCTLFTSKVFKDNAVMRWIEVWPWDSKVQAFSLMWGTEEGNFTDSINLNPYQDSIINTTVVENLQPGTKYFAQIHRVYDNDLYDIPFVFTTPPLDPIPPVPSDDCGYINPANIPVRITSPRQTLPVTFSKEINSVKVTTINGREVSRFPYVSLKNTKSTITRSRLCPGLYIATFLNKKDATVSSTSFLIN